ncbi:MAG: Thiolase, N-terminal domain-containing protein [Olpidium bornovanus]|uniref:acetyl-CoA C-acetyltransferase n=1 Tax=Olpidium bornovanus TaxID=278681 RepID=A0A8H7ZLL7_9FUNG|nr:MAG: Thiolase, N-terminal domain-containing protein [Olpidium bornovanus]
MLAADKMGAEAYIVAAVRTPIGRFNGSLAPLSAVQLGSAAIKGALEKCGVAAAEVDEVIMGNVLSAGLGQNPARQAARFAGLPDRVVCTTVNKVCASGMKAVAFAVQSLLLGTADVVVAGGMESMTNAPYYLPKMRFGSKYGDVTAVDGLARDGLTDAYDNKAMGFAAEECAKEYGITRQMQDDYAIQSYRRAQEATDQKLFADEIVPVVVKGPRGKGDVVVDKDDEVTNLNVEKLRAIPAIFVTDGTGTVTAANGSPISDGACALVLVSRSKLEKLGVKPVARVIGWADAEQSPVKFTTSPSLAIPKALRHAGLTSLDDVDAVELNEAFAVVACANAKILDLGYEKMNVFGGAVSMGHPLGW